MKDAAAPVAVGTRIRTRIEDRDLDAADRERGIPVGTAGRIVAVPEPPASDLFVIAWENGGVTSWTVEELARDAEVV